MVLPWEIIGRVFFSRDRTHSMPISMETHSCEKDVLQKKNSKSSSLEILTQKET